MVFDSLDTCVLISAILGAPVEQRDAVWELLETKSTTHIISDLAISEAVYVLEEHYKQTREQVVYGVKKFLDTHNNVLNYNRALFELVFPFYEEHPALSFNDCCMAFYAELNHAEPLFTFDRTLAKQHPSAKRLE